MQLDDRDDRACACLHASRRVLDGVEPRVCVFWVAAYVQRRMAASMSTAAPLPTPTAPPAKMCRLQAPATPAAAMPAMLGLALHAWVRVGWPVRLSVTACSLTRWAFEPAPVLHHGDTEPARSCCMGCHKKWHLQFNHIQCSSMLSIMVMLSSKLECAIRAPDAAQVRCSLAWQC